MTTIEQPLPQLPEKVARCMAETKSRLSSLRKDDFVSDALFYPSTHLLNGSGKLLRPAMVFLGATTIGEDPRKFIDMAVAIELLHTSSLIHDDIIDRDGMRRGVAAVHSKYGGEAAILAGDALISKAIQLSCNYGTMVIKAVSKAAMDMCAGEALDFRFQNERSTPSVEQYLEIASLKCASLIASSCAIPAIHVGNPASESLYSFGRNVGMAFQIKDDIYDIAGGSAPAQDRELVRPNLVTALQKELSLDKRAAQSKAVEMNRAYINEAENALRGSSVASLLIPYANAIAAEAMAVPETRK